MKRWLVYHLSENAEWIFVGSVLLGDEPACQHIEHALASLGLYAPRGLDRVVAHPQGLVIVDASDEPIVCLELAA